MNYGLQQRDIDNIARAIKQFPEIEEAVLFGSRAMGNYKKGSDVDIAIKGKDVSNDTISHLSSLLNEEIPLPYFFDVIRYEKISNEKLIEHINEYGIAIIN